MANGPLLEMPKQLSRRAGISEPSSLYPSEDEIGQYVLAKRNAKQWSKLAPLLEREGLPQIDRLMGGRFWPAVRAFFERRHGLRRGEVPSSADGEEVWL